MVERAPQTKRDEQYPLLKVDGGGGDGGVHQQPSPTLVTPGWGVTCSPKRPWTARWPEYISACWMTLILLGISFLSFFTLGMEAYRRQNILIIRCNSSKPASDVFYHHIVHRGNSAPFIVYADYLSEMATQYPSLNFHVLFLVDDTLQTTYRGPRHARYVNKMVPLSTVNLYSFSNIEDGLNRDIAEFEARYQNVNVTIMSLSKYMLMTPLRYKWKAIPLSYLPFYARIFSVWQNGGVALDLTYFNNNYNNRRCTDRRVSAIMKQHNDGIKVDEYTNALNKIDRDEENELLTIFYSFIHQILNETRIFLSKSLTFPQITTEKGVFQNEPLNRTNRKKRNASTPIYEDRSNKSETNSNVYKETINSRNYTDLKKNEYQTLPTPDANENFNNVFKDLQVNNGSVDGVNKTEGLNKSELQTKPMNGSDTRQVVLFYDLSVFSDSVAPSFVMPEPLFRSGFRQNTKSSDFGKVGKNGHDGLLSMDSEGMFIAVSLKLHPFLGHLFSAGCQRMDPKLAIQDTLLTQCSGIFKEDSYCNNIYLL